MIDYISGLLSTLAGNPELIRVTFYALTLGLIASLLTWLDMRER